MKPHCFFFVLLATPLLAQSSASQGSVGTVGQPAASSQTLLNLPRLKSKGQPGEVAPLARGKVTVDSLAPQGAPGAKVAQRQNVVHLTLESGKPWSRPLRGAATDITFVSFLVNASLGSVIDIGGARLAISPGTRPGYAKLSLGAPGTNLAPGSAFADHVKLETHAGASLAALPLLTVRLDPAAGVWDLYVFQRLVAEDIPLVETRGARQFTLSPGAQGAMVMNLTLSDENPLFVDANNNGIDDAFEKQKRNGALLAARAPAADRKALANEWKSAQTAAKVAAWKIRRPVPDESVTAVIPK